MIRAFQIAPVSDFRLKPLNQGRQPCIIGLVLALLLGLFFIGCSEPEEEPIWEKVKVGDLAPDEGDSNKPKLVKAVHLEVHVLEIPADNIDQLDKVRKQLRIRPLRLTSFKAFDGNSFLARFGRGDLWNLVRTVLTAANAREVAKVSLMLPDGEPQTLNVTGLRAARTIFYTAADGTKQGANIGPGPIGLRVKADKIPGRKGVCEVVAYPVFYLPINSAIRKLDSHLKRREFPFTAAAFGLKMSPGDFVYLAPKQFVSDQTDLGGLFFTNLRGSVFFDRAERKPPERKTAVRVFLLACTRIDD